MPTREALLDRLDDAAHVLDDETLERLVLAAEAWRDPIEPVQLRPQGRRSS